MRVAIKHGAARKGQFSPEYKVWRDLKRRCWVEGRPNPKAHTVVVCAEWFDSYEAFLRDMGPKPDGTMIERVDRSKGFELGNARWAPSWERKADPTGPVPNSSLPEYKVWKGIKSRCYTPSATGYARYGGRGIGMVPEWKDDFEGFFRNVGRRPSKFHTLDRPDNDRDYGPDNFRWATQKEQAQNRRSTIKVTFRGQVRTIAEWIALADPALALDWDMVWHRLKAGWRVEAALTIPKDTTVGTRKGDRI